ncbi:hypothetical protein W97_01014 [Coniosporium apollinis CBS 100218]|uniref:Methyltransferase type 11 domain-containing protein n=1 Tax=Coniosporium apollinis (strain CBS 100218) TaxID=1168221 RepID=R7YIP8_CONA1|nr:uncharacterized protein W97_01014 [Coniosporium apollinis CBS 100218]EON61797.1 hypothetical protein W97_01014 [Coniosporium apollinis CBS 100218]
MADDFPRGESYEAEHVHAVYEQIASHFSSTRYKPWPIVTSFLSSLPPGAIGLDVGCGNGKNLSTARGTSASSLSLSSGIFTLGSDRSPSLIRLAAQHQQHRSGADVVVADALALPHPRCRFDFAICVAVLHHFSTAERRVEGMKGVLEVLRPRHKVAEAGEAGEAGDGKGAGLENAGDRDGEGGKNGDGGGKALFTVWALEQQGSRRGWDEGCEQDVMVPWVMKGGAGGGKVRKKGRREEAKERLIAKSTAEVAENSEDGASEKREGLGEEEGLAAEEQERTFHRYYHLYKKGELEHDIVEAGGVVLESGYEKDNWWAVAARQAT